MFKFMNFITVSYGDRKNTQHLTSYFGIIIMTLVSKVNNAYDRDL